MNTLYVKTFSKGQMTIPKAIRQEWGVGDSFWVKLSLSPDKSLAVEPIFDEWNASASATRLKNVPRLPQSWFGLEEMRQMRTRAEEKLKKQLLDW